MSRVIKKVPTQLVNGKTLPGFVIVECDCGEEVICQGFTSTCECGADYNWNGEQLAPREFWGEETGEEWWECY